MEGIVTMEDVIETLLGMEIVDESDNTEDMQALARKNWETRAGKMGIAIDPLEKDPQETAPQESDPLEPTEEEPKKDKPE